MAQYTENRGIDDQPKVGLAKFQNTSLFRSRENFQRFIFVIASPQLWQMMLRISIKKSTEQ
jgi:hypothetical protein